MSSERSHKRRTSLQVREDALVIGAIIPV